MTVIASLTVSGNISAMLITGATNLTEWTCEEMYKNQLVEKNIFYISC